MRLVKLPTCEIQMKLTSVSRDAAAACTISIQPAEASQVKPSDLIFSVTAFSITLWEVVETS